MAAQESQAKIKVVLDTADAEAVLERLNESLGGRGPGQAGTAAAAPRAGEAAAGGGRDAGRGGGATVLGGGVGGKLSQIIKLLAVVAAVMSIFEPVIMMLKELLERLKVTAHSATGLDQIGAKAEEMAAIRTFAEQLGEQIQAKDPDQVRKIIEAMQPIFDAQFEGRRQGRIAASDLLR